MWTLAEHQRYALFMMDCNPCLGIFYDMGCGKTAVALMWILNHLKAGEIEDALVICPASIVPTWDVAIGNMSNFEGVTEDDVALLREKVTVVSYQKTFRSEKIPVRHKDGRVSYRKHVGIRPEIDKRWGAIFLDESHKAGEHNSITSKSVYTLSQLTDHRYIMSGTPVHGGGGRPDYKKMYGQMRFLDNDIWRTWGEFCQDCIISFDHWGNPAKYREDVCEGILHDHGIVCRLEDVFDMPGYSEEVIPCPLSAKKAYNDIKAGRFLQYGIDIEVSGMQYNKLLQICSGSMKRETDTMRFDCSKESALKDLVEGASGKVVVFCKYRASVDRAAELCENIGRKVIRYDGRSRKDAWQDFQYGDAEVIVCQYQAGSEGLDLFAANVMVFYEPCFSAKDLEQAKRRIYRKGQEHPCIYYYLVTPQTIEEKVLSTVRAGVDVTDEMLSRWANE